MNEPIATALQAVLSKVITAAGVDLGNIQSLEKNGRELHITVHQGFKKDFLDHFRSVRPFDSTPCGRAAALSMPVVVGDVLKDPCYEPHRAIARSYGYRSVISFPLISRKGGSLGVLSVHGRTPDMEWPLKKMEPFVKDAVSILESRVLQ